MDYNSNLLLKATEYGLINKEKEAKLSFSPQLVINDYDKGLKVLTQINKELNACCSFCFSVAFITYSGVNILLETFKNLEEKGIEGKILTSNYLNFSEPKALQRLSEFKNLKIKIYDKSSFHIKGYLFEHSNYLSILIGSSNITQQALLSNKEWNLKISGEENGALLSNTISEFNRIWDEGTPLTKKWLEKYENNYYKTKKLRNEVTSFNIKTLSLKPNAMQINAVKALTKIREKGENKAILVSATGTGKTYLSAYDVKNFKPKKLLFLAHREQLLIQAEESFKTVLGPEINTGFLSGKFKDYKSKYLFSTMNMMAKDLIYKKFRPDEFDYIIIDEAHRSASNSYQKIINYFKPKFLFGMTATPSRTDAKDILPIFDRNIALRIDLKQAMEYDLLCPFHYFGISEIKINGEIVNDNTSINKLSCDERVKNIIEKINFYGYSGNRAKGLIFCKNVEEAKILSIKFNNLGYRTIALCAENSINEREEAIERLEMDEKTENSLDYIFSVDVFNEGVDIPSINQIILLRPTESAVIFVQQLGRGLRKYNDKEFLVVLDFIGNYEKNYCIPMALTSDKSFNREIIRKTVSDGSSFLAGCSTIEFDQVSKHQIYNAIDNSKLSAKRNIKEEYSFLKSELSHIPSFFEFNKFAEVSFDLVIDNYESYYQLIKECEKNNTPYDLNRDELYALNYLTKKIAKGKDIETINLLDSIINTSPNIINETIVNYNTKNNQVAIKVLAHEYNTVLKTKNSLIKHEACKLIQIDDKKIIPTKNLISYLKNPTFLQCSNEIINYAKEQNKTYFSKKYKDTKLTLFQKYSYEEVCKFLNWEKDQSAVMNGYMFDKKTNTLPVFINYEKEDSAINYQDKFISKSLIVAISKKNRTKYSKDWNYIYNSKANKTKIYLFVRKNKATNNSKDFYFLGEITPIGESSDLLIDNLPAFQINYKLETPVRDDIYEYFTTAE
ncbi:MAG: DUF3427 domain-containing protein [Pleomorphochaeta sp.]